MKDGPLSIALAALVLLAARPAHAQEAQGFAEVRASAFPGADGQLWQVVERVRPTLKAELVERVTLVATVEAALAQGRNPVSELERTLESSGSQFPGAVWPRYENALLRVNGGDDYLDVDRLYVDVYGEAFDLRLGRQALNWGSAQFFNPTDPFPEVLLAEPWRPRRGVNSARLTVPFGEAHDVAAVLATNDAFTELRAAGRVRVNWEGNDFALVGAWRGQDRNALVGVDLRGNLLVGWWIEAAWLFGQSPHEELSVGIDYSFPVLERATVFLQYYRNGAGSPRPDLSSRLVSLGAGGAPSKSDTRDPFAPFTVGRDYLLLGSALGVTEDLTGSLAVVQNLNDGSGFAVPTVGYALLDWLELSSSLQLPYALFAGGGEFNPGRKDLLLPLPAADGAQPLTVDLSGLVPTATLTLWARASF